MTDEDPTPFPNRPHLRNSRQIVWDRAPATPAAVDALAHLLAELEAREARQRARRAVDRARLASTLGAVVLDLFVAAGDDADMFVAYSRRNQDYATDQRRYLPPGVTATTVRQVAQGLEAAGFAEGKRGSYQRGELGGKGYRSRLRATPRLVSFLADRGVTLADIGVREDAEVIRLKGPAETRGGPKPLLGYEDTPEVVRMRTDLRAWIAVAARHDIRPSSNRWGMTDRALQDDGDGAGEVVDLHRARLYRVFNDGRWTAGGRFYGGWWLTMPGADRRNITIDGGPVVELDFKALHPRLAYHLEGRPLAPEDDPYDLGERWSAVDRGVIKVAFNQLLAVGPKGHIRKPKGVTLPRGLTYPLLLAALETRHAPIRAWLRAGRAVDLQNLDSRIAEKVLGYFTAIGRVALPVHDSFIVSAEDEYKLGETMFLAYSTALKDITQVTAWPVVKGWTAGAGIEDGVLATMLRVEGRSL